MRSGELFAGVGGLGMAVDAVFGTTPAWFAEVDDAPSKVLAYRHPDVPNLGDVTKVDWPTTPRVQVLAGGFPCQDVSLAGRRKGMRDGTRSGLWSEYARAIDIIRPDWIVIENVRGLLSADAAGDVEPCPLCVGDNPGHVLRALGAVLGDLADLGFDAEWTGIRASDVGAPHGRFRVFILAWPAERTVPDAERGGRERRAAEQRGASVDIPGDDSRAVHSALTLLPTPIVSDGTGGPKQLEGARFAPQMREITQLLPTPGAYDGERGGSQHPDKRRAGNHSVSIQDVAEHLELLEGTAHAASEARPSEVLSSVRRAVDADEIRQRSPRGSERVPAEEPLLEEVRIHEASGAAGHASVEGESGGTENGVRAVLSHGRSAHSPSGSGRDKQRAGEPSGALQVVSSEAPLAGRPDVPSRAGSGTAWGPYRAAIERWERVLGRPAPAPVLHDGKGGKARLNAALCEFMMGWPAGHVTDPAIGLSRAEQLKACGNGVVPQQAAAALRELLARDGVPAIREEVAA